MQPLFDRFDRRGAAENAPNQSASMTREQVIDRILSINPGAGRGFLDQFEKPELDRYLARLDLTRGPRQGSGRWVRQGSSPAIVASSAAA